MSGPIRVTKMSGAGNDFLVLDAEQAARLGSSFEAWIARACRRGLSVGADGVLVVAPLRDGRVSVRFRNPDGAPAFCGNGTRCAARFAHRAGFAGSEMILETDAGAVPAQLQGDRVRLVLPPPRDHGTVRLELDGESLEGRLITAGVPHFVVFVESPADAPLERWGPLARRHVHFGKPGANVDVASRSGGGPLRLRTWERGVEGETLACGSGAVAAAYASVLQGAPSPVTVLPASRVALRVDLIGQAERPSAAELLGDARFVFEADLDDEAVAGFD